MWKQQDGFSQDLKGVWLIPQTVWCPSNSGKEGVFGGWCHPGLQQALPCILQVAPLCSQVPVAAGEELAKNTFILRIVNAYSRKTECLYLLCNHRHHHHHRGEILMFQVDISEVNHTPPEAPQFHRWPTVLTQDKHLLIFSGYYHYYYYYLNSGPHIC